MQPPDSQQIILAVDGSALELTRILQYARSTQWRKDQLILVAIVPRPVSAFFHEPQWFGRTISPEEFELLKERLRQCCEQFLADGYRTRVQVIHCDDTRDVQASLMALKPDLLVTPRSSGTKRLFGWFRPSNACFLIDLLPCPVLVV